MGFTAAVVLAGSSPPQMQIARAAEQTTVMGAADSVTGAVHIVGQFAREAPSRVTGGIVTFEPGAHSSWHTHPLGQTLIITDGIGYVQEWGRPIRRVSKGDIVWTPPGVKHWHGATPTSSMTHVAIQEAIDGQIMGKDRKVTPEEYAAMPSE